MAVISLDEFGIDGVLHGSTPDGGGAAAVRRWLKTRPQMVFVSTGEPVGGAPTGATHYQVDDVTPA